LLDLIGNLHNVFNAALSLDGTSTVLNRFSD